MGRAFQSARRWLQREGFKYTLHKKALYYDGLDRADVVKDRQTRSPCHGNVSRTVSGVYNGESLLEIK